MTSPPTPLSSREHIGGSDGADAPIALANRLLTSHPPEAAEHERGLAMLQSLANTNAGSGAHARWLLGAYYLQVCSRSGAQAQARYWLGRAAADGTPSAVDRLADFHLSGLGDEVRMDQALFLQLRLANQGYQRAAWQAAYLIDHHGPFDGLDAASAFLRACALGYPPAYYSLGLRFATGNGVARDVAFGHALLRRAADAGYVGAADAAAQISAADGDGQDWYARLRDNLHAVHPAIAGLVPGCPDGRQPPHPMLPELERHLVSVGHPALRLDGAGRARIAADAVSVAAPVAPRGWSWQSKNPGIAVCRNFATREECAHLINKVAAALRPAADYRRGDSANENAELESFSGRGHPIGALHTDAVTRMLDRRVATMAQWTTDRLEPCSIICYRPGEEYRPHVDFFSDAQMLANAQRRRDFGGQRIATFLLYLKAPRAGGETSYLDCGVDIAGEDGMGVIHYNVTSDGGQDPASIHAGRPVIDGEKWLWRSTLRQHSLYGQADRSQPAST